MLNKYFSIFVHSSIVFSCIVVLLLFFCRYFCLFFFLLFFVLILILNIFVSLLHVSSAELCLVKNVCPLFMEVHAGGEVL